MRGACRRRACRGAQGVWWSWSWSWSWAAFGRHNKASSPWTWAWAKKQRRVPKGNWHGSQRRATVKDGGHGHGEVCLHRGRSGRGYWGSAGHGAGATGSRARLDCSSRRGPLDDAQTLARHPSIHGIARTALTPSPDSTPCCNRRGGAGWIAMSLEMRARQAARRGSRVDRGSRMLRRKVRCKDAQSHGSGPGSRSPTSPLVCDSSKRPTIPLTARRACLPTSRRRIPSLCPAHHAFLALCSHVSNPLPLPHVLPPALVALCILSSSFPLV
jgi:hypothetical protein